MASHVTDVYAEAVRWYLKDRDGMLARLSRWLRRTETGCIEWVGTKNNCGYGYLTVRRQGRSLKLYVHRLFLVLRLRRDLQPGFEVGHQCGNRACVLHLEEQSRLENMREMNERKKRNA